MRSCGPEIPHPESRMPGPASLAPSPQRRAVFLDRDGVINALVYRPEEDRWDSPFSVPEFQLLPGVAEAIRLVNEMGLLAIVISNQPGIAKGKCDRATLERLTALMRAELRARGARLDGIYYCRHHPDAVVPELRRHCQCRKPKPGLLLRAAREHAIDLTASYMVGDKAKDIEAGLGAGCMTILLQQNSNNAELAPEVCQPHWMAADLLAAVSRLMSHVGG